MSSPRPGGQSDPEGRRQEVSLGGNLLTARRVRKLLRALGSCPLRHQRSSACLCLQAEFSHWLGGGVGRPASVAAASLSTLCILLEICRTRLSESVLLVE